MNLPRAGGKRKGGLKSYPPEIPARVQINIDQVKVAKQALDMIAAEQRICGARCHEEKRLMMHGRTQASCMDETLQRCNVLIMGRLHQRSVVIVSFMN